MRQVSFFAQSLVSFCPLVVTQDICLLLPIDYIPPIICPKLLSVVPRLDLALSTMKNKSQNNVSRQTN